MKSFLTTTLVIFCIFFTGCETLIPGASSKKEEKSRQKIDVINKSISTNAESKLESISAFSYGVDYQLRLIPDQTKEIETALSLNSRIMSLSGTPALDKMKEMKAMIDQLNSEVSKVRLEGQKKLELKDAEIVTLQNIKKDLESQKDAEILRYMKNAKDAAALADTSKLALDELQEKMNSWGGFGAIIYGFKRIIIRLAWGIGIFSVLFIVLRIASATNPIAASIFSIFNIIGSWAINGLKTIFPKAVEMAGHVNSSVFNEYKSCMVKIIDCIQLVKDRSKKNGTTPNLEEVMEEVSKTLNDNEVNIINDIKRSLNWK